MKAWITFNQRSTRHYTRCAKALYRGWIRRFAKRRCSRHCSASSDIFLQYVHTAFTSSGFPDLQTGRQPQVKRPQLLHIFCSSDGHILLQSTGVMYLCKHRQTPSFRFLSMHSTFAQQIHVLPYFPCQRLCQKVLECEKGEVIRGRILHIQAKLTL